MESKSALLGIKIGPAEAERLAEVCALFSLSKSDFVRYAVNSLTEELGFGPVLGVTTDADYIKFKINKELNKPKMRRRIKRLAGALLNEKGEIEIDDNGGQK